jgi:hypothetical protein
VTVWLVSMLATALAMTLLLTYWTLRVLAPVSEGARGYVSPAHRESQRRASDDRYGR